MAGQSRNKAGSVRLEDWGVAPARVNRVVDVRGRSLQPQNLQRVSVKPAEISSLKFFPSFVPCASECWRPPMCV